MRGLAFPHNAHVDRETSHEYGTPISNVDDIPIDPALAGTVIDPALMMEDVGTNGVQHKPEPEQPVFEHQPHIVDDFQLRQYSEVPEGDPFAQQIPTPFFPIQPPQPPPPPKPKRKRRIRREETCGFCGSDESKNKLGQPEILLTCNECGRSGHPSCMQLTKVTDVVRAYNWKCIECKNCEICQEKGDDDRILFCDWCDRGWHMDCVSPALEEPPDGEWHCPLCPPVPEAIQMLDSQQADRIEVEIEDDTTREASVASTSRSPVEVPPNTARRGRKKANARGRGRTSRIPVFADSPEPDDGIDVDINDTPVAVPKNQGRPRKSNARRKIIALATSDEEEEVETSPRPTKRRRAPARLITPPSAPLPRVRLRLPGHRGKGKEREEEEPSHGLFDDILASEERDTTKTTITNSDKLYFERSRIAAEEKITQATHASSSTRTLEHMDDFVLGRTRPLRSSTLHHSNPLPKPVDFSNSPGPSTPGGGSMPPVIKFEPGVLRIRNIRFGPYDIKTWYDAPFPEEYASIPDGKLWICEFCLKYMKSPFAATRHQMKCKARHPPGDEIYRDGAISIFEVDGRRNKIYCQNLCLLSKMFLDHKSLFYDVEPFLFYVITQVDEFGARFVGYFSKEKRCPKDYNLSCIMTLPVRQRQGWGNLLIDFSYLLSKIEQRTGTPEKPLSSLGALGYGKYWTLAVMRFLRTAPDNVRLEDISSATSMTIEDVCNTLTQQNMIYIREPTPPLIRPSPGQSIKFPRGRKNGLARRQLHRLQTQDKPTGDNGTSTHPVAALFVPPKHYEIHFDREKVDEYLRNWEAKGYVKLKPEKLQWTPYITSRSPQEANLPAMPAMDTVLDESSKSSTQPATPILEHDGSTEFHMSEDAERDDHELPSIVDKPGRTRTRSSMMTPTMDLPTLRSTRSHRMKSPSPPLSLLTPSRSLRTRSSNANFVPLSEDSPSVRTTQRSTAGKKTSGKAKVDIVSNDEAFAVKLAMEEQMQQSRQLRSRRSELQSENKRPVQVTGPTRTAQSRKRRRVDSSPEVVEDVRARSEHPVDLQDDADARRMDVDSVVEPKVNGNHDLVNVHEQDVNVETDTPEQTLVEGNHVSAAEEVEVVVVDEDAETPLTSLTSQQSLPSDDTVFTLPGGYPKHAESDIRSTLETPGLIDLDECHDEDADGEYEEDAEGEPDPELEIY